MALIKSVRGKTPEFGADCYLAENATVIGDVVTGASCSIWFNTVIRGDVNSIRLGDRVNVQDGTVIHCTWHKSKTLIGDDVSIGHNAVIHGCTIHSGVLIGMGAIVMDLAVIDSFCIVAAGAVILENQHLESGHIYGGVPAKKIKPVDAETLRFYIERTAKNYVDYSKWYREN